MIKNLRYLCTLLLIAVASAAWADDVLVYTLDGTQTGGSNGYATESEITQNDITWMVMGNTTMSPWRIGGKNLTNEDRPLYSTSTIGDNISRVVVTNGTVNTGLTVNSISLVVSSNADFSNATNVEGVFAANSTTTFERPTGADWTNKYFKIVYNVTAGSSNTFVQFIKADFYMATSNPTCGAPVFSPVAGTYTSAQNVTISSTTEGASIYYTLDSSEPSATNGKLYSDPIIVSSTTTIKAIAVKDDYNNSTVESATYTIVSIEHAGTESDPYTVADARAAIDAGIGTTDVYATGIVSAIPTAYSSQYSNITFNFVDKEGDTEFLQAFRCVGDEAANVQIGDIVVVNGNLTKYNSTYEFDAACKLVSLKHPTVAVEAPTFNPAAGTYADAQTVSISCETDGATIYYTTDGTDPSDASMVFTDAISVTTTTTIKAISIKDGEKSAVVSATYHINSQANPYTVAQALAFNEYPANGIYVHGIVSTAPTLAPTDAGQLTYYISDNGEATEQLQVYKGKGLEQAAFTAQNDIQVGDIVTIYGNVKIYNNTKEFDTNNYLVSFERPVAPYVLPVPTFAPEAGEVESGTIVKIVVPTDDDNIDYVLYSFDNENWEEYTEETVIKIEEETTIYARSVGVDGSKGEIASAEYTVKAVTPAQDVVIVEDGKTTFLFNTEGNEWGFPTEAKEIDPAEFTANGKTIKLEGTTGNGYRYYLEDKYLILGQKGAYLTLPAFDFEVGKIEVVGRSKASNAVKQNIFVGDNAVSTETTGAQGMNTYVIAADYQAAGNVYTLKVTSAHNTQITQIVVYKATGEEKADPQLRFSTATVTATLGSEFAAPTLSYVDGFDGTVKYESSNPEVATVDATTGEVTLVAAGDAIIKATSEETTNYLAGEASYTLTVKEPAVAGDDKYELVTAASTLKAGDEIVFAFVGTLKISSVDTKVAQAMGTEFGNNSVLLAVDVVDNEDQTISTGDDVMFLTLGGAEDAWTFESNGKYLTSTGKKKNEDGTTPSTNQNTIELTEDGTDTHAQAHIQMAEDGEATVTFNGGNGCNWLQYNVNGGKNQRFSCYSAKMSGLQIYRKVTSTETHSGNVNGDPDGKVDIADVTALVNIIVNNSTLTPEQLAAGDFDNSGNLTVEDVEALVNKILSNQ